MTVLISIDGYSLNMGLQKIAQDRKLEARGQNRFRIDYENLADLLMEKAEDENSILNFYTDSKQVSVAEDDSRIMGRVTKYFHAKGYGFIAATDGNSYFFHNNELINKRALCNSDEDRYPHPTSREFKNRLLNKVVTFNPLVLEDGKTRAEEVKLEFGARALDRFYHLRREPFLEMLEDTGYKVIRCRSYDSSGKAKSIDCQIVIDALCELEEDDHFMLLSNDAVFCELLTKLKSFKIKTSVVTFDSHHSEELRKHAKDNIILLDDYLDELELAFEEDISEESEALVG